MFKTFNNIPLLQQAPNQVNGVNLEVYPENNLPPVQAPLLDNPKELVTFVTSDIYDLFNAERLIGASADVVASIRSNMSPSSQVSDVISKMSDEQILETIKPRNLQAPSQLILWSKHMQSLIESHIEDFRSQYAPESEPALEQPTSTTEK